MLCDACHEWENYDVMTYCDLCGLNLCPDCDTAHLPSCAGPGEEEDD